MGWPIPDRDESDFRQNDLQSAHVYAPGIRATHRELISSAAASQHRRRDMLAIVQSRRETEFALQSNPKLSQYSPTQLRDALLRRRATPKWCDAHLNKLRPTFPSIASASARSQDDIAPQQPGDVQRFARVAE